MTFNIISLRRTQDALQTHFFALVNLQAERLKVLKHILDAMLAPGIGVPLFGLFLIWPLAASSGMARFARSALPVCRSLGELLASLRYITYEPCCDSVGSVFFFWASGPAAKRWVFSERRVAVAMWVSFMLTTAHNVFGPKFAEFYAKGEMETMSCTARRSVFNDHIVGEPHLSRHDILVERGQ